ncbi:MAG: restriction endonuclease, SacI family [Candidatus Peribacteraceae bacterium]|nr:restriction endonuclease, SacI family [Candidatus Peribacteraceae bacterium]MDD5742773.1 restriction endonuclease, SacI family [Candidatus Peribacteraceae bacterium]
MPIRINKEQAAVILRKAATLADKGKLHAGWMKKIEHLSQLCQEGVSKTHIAFLGTAILAKATDRNADLFAIKPEHAKSNHNSFSARTLCHSVLVPLAAELGFSLGVSGREPLNNQPYFRMTRLDDGTPVHTGGKAAFDYMVGLVRELQRLPNESSAKKALSAFIRVRRGYQIRYKDYEKGNEISPEELIGAIEEFVRGDSEGGKRAQAVVAGLLDTFAGEERVESGRINDPSRNYPGDVCIRSSSDPTIWEKAFEVRDKPVKMNDAQIFGKKCIDMGVREAALVMVSDQQKQLDGKELKSWAEGFGIGLTLFHGWSSFVEQVLFWSEQPEPVAATMACERIYGRLVRLKTS